MAYSCDIVTETAVVTGTTKPASVVSTLLATAVFAAATFHAIVTPVHESAVVTGVATENRYVVIRDSAVVTGTATATIHGQDTARDSAVITSRITSKLANTANETAVASGTAYPGVAGTVLRETAVIRDSVTQTATLRDVLTDSARLSDRTVQQAVAKLSETAVVTGSATDHVIATSIVHETAVITGTATPVNHAFSTVLERAVLRDTISATLHAVEIVYETAAISGYVVPPLSGIAWTASSDTFAMSRYSGYRFNSAAVIGGRLIAAGDGGLYALAGDDDAGVPIVATLTTGLSDAGDPQQKRSREVFVGYEADGSLSMKVSGTGTGAEAGYTYTLPSKTAGDPTANRVKIGRGMRSRFWRFELSNPSGDPFKITETRVIIDTLSRKI